MSGRVAPRFHSLVDELAEPVVRLAQRFGRGKPETLIRWHRKGFRLFWRWKSRPMGRPGLPKDIQALIHQMASENPTWGQEHIANELN